MMQIVGEMSTGLDISNELTSSKFFPRLSNAMITWGSDFRVFKRHEKKTQKEKCEFERNVNICSFRRVKLIIFITDTLYTRIKSSEQL